MRPYRDITDSEWQRVARLLPELRPRKELRGRPLADARDVLNGVLWVIFSCASWSAIPRRYPAYQTCHRRFMLWYESGTLHAVLNELFGPDCDDLYETVTVRMRKHVHSRAAEIRHALVPNRIHVACAEPRPEAQPRLEPRMPSPSDPHSGA
ncbi:MULTISPECIES: transposase [Burkholderia]|uniref:transposase n=1 Tax=Burkholderia TaxID=32008 RepID=UPI0004696A69|nr:MULTISPECIES: transposase [Burkholderia]KGE05481.1 transposase [Burkholderia gladioli]KVM62394.1 transposase [Burkholderia gladioli]NBI49787.1 transposase [Burkholderia sp. ISTR5]NIF70665.1 transposase [Burkholderia sp. Ap-962]